MILLESPAERLSISVYGWPHSEAVGAVGAQVLDPPAPLYFDTPRSSSDKWAWLYQWAGDIDKLVTLLSTSSDPATRSKAIESLDILSIKDPNNVRSIIRHPAAVQNISLSTSEAARRLENLVSSPSQLRARYGLAEQQLVESSDGDEESHISRLLDLADGYTKRSDTEAKLSLDAIFDILPDAPSDPVLSIHLANILPRLYVISRLRGFVRRLPLHTDLARPVIKALVQVSTEVIDGKSCWEAARTLSEPYLPFLDPHDPLRNALETAVVLPTSGLCDIDTLAGRRLRRLETALDTSTPFHPARSGIVHEATPAELVRLIAPQLYASLQTSAIPPLGIAARAPSAEALAQASAFAGKVYNLHEFRRERENGGGGSGLGVGAGAVGRPASRHVDDFGMAPA